MSGRLVNRWKGMDSLLVCLVNFSRQLCLLLIATACFMGLFLPFNRADTGSRIFFVMPGAVSG